MDELAWPGLSISIANIGVSLECNDASVIDRLNNRWAAFAGTDRIALIARIHIDPDRDPVSIDRPAAFRNGSLQFTSTSYAGYIDPAQGVGVLTISNGQPLEDIEYFLRVAYALLIFRAGGLLMHAAGIVRDDRAFLFFGPSGSGKSTAAQHSPNDVILNDDLVALLPIDDHWAAYATPFWNQPQLRPNDPQHAVLVGLYRLIQDRSVYLETISSAQATAEIIASTPMIPGDPDRNTDLLERVNRIGRTLPVYGLHFLPDDSFWSVIV